MDNVSNGLTAPGSWERLKKFDCFDDLKFVWLILFLLNSYGSFC